MLGWLGEFVFLAQTLAQETRKQTQEMENALMAQAETAVRHKPNVSCLVVKIKPQDPLIASLACCH